MPCASPLQATFSLRSDGKKDIKFSSTNARLFHKGIKPIGDNNMGVPCGKCMPCRLEKSRQMAMRCVHESKMYEYNSTVTLTYSKDGLPDNASLYHRHIVLFMKSLRQKFSDIKIRVYGCGEYGENNDDSIYGLSKLGRPHYHLCLFNLDFLDKVKWKKIGDFWQYTSEVLTKLWPHGQASCGIFNFETAAYCARYCTKKVNGEPAEAHYTRILASGELVKVKPEYLIFSNQGGIGKPWIEKFGKTDVFPHDNVVIRGARCKPPRYYDILREREDPAGFAKAKEARRERGELKADDNSFKRLAVKLKCQEARFNKLIRAMEK